MQIKIKKGTFYSGKNETKNMTKQKIKKKKKKNKICQYSTARYYRKQ